MMFIVCVYLYINLHGILYIHVQMNPLMYTYIHIYLYILYIFFVSSGHHSSTCLKICLKVLASVVTLVIGLQLWFWRLFFINTSGTSCSSKEYMHHPSTYIKNK